MPTNNQNAKLVGANHYSPVLTSAKAPFIFHKLATRTRLFILCCNDLTFKPDEILFMVLKQLEKSRIFSSVIILLLSTMSFYTTWDGITKYAESKSFEEQLLVFVLVLIIQSGLVFSLFQFFKSYSSNQNLK